MRCPRLLAVILLTLGAACVVALPSPAARSQGEGRQADGPFLVKPYLQLGDASVPGRSERLDVLWHAQDAAATRWAVEVRRGGKSEWEPARSLTNRRVAVGELEPFRVFRATLEGLPPGGEVEYRIVKDGAPAFAATTRARRPASQPHRFAVFGDSGASTPAQRAVAFQTHQARPDFVFVTGDMVYSRGRVSEYRRNWFPFYNADTASPATGAPLMRSTLFLAAPGNHDIGNRNLGEFPDTLAYFMFWSQPLNGPLVRTGAPNTPTLQGPEANQQAFLAAAGEAYPRMANFSFDYGNAHWTVLDGNAYVDWTDAGLRAWVTQDLAAAKDAAWRFVGFHQPGFHSSKAHFNEQRMRLLAPVFEAGKVDVVFAGHVHNYQRTLPMHFAPERQPDGKWVAGNGNVAGKWTLDRRFDGERQTRPDGVIYVVSGAGGNTLYNPEQQDDPASWQPFTHRFVSKTHSLTVVDVNGRRMTVRQVSDEGRELDRFVVSR